jgi:hypothetical protein
MHNQQIVTKIAELIYTVQLPNNYGKGRLSINYITIGVQDF